MVKFITNKRINKYLSKEKKVKSLLFTSSTNDDLKKSILNAGVYDAIVSELQFKGRGRLKRKFHSPMFSGIYISIRLKNSFDYASVGRITTCVAVLVSKAIESLYDVKVGVKWVNDLFINGKKVAGILAESVIKDGKIQGIIVGIGLNVYDKKFPKELENITTNLQKETGKKVDRNQIIAKILESLDGIYEQIQNDDFICEYKKKMFLLNKKVVVSSGDNRFEAICVDVTYDGKLVVIKGNEKIEISVGDVSVKSAND